MRLRLCDFVLFPSILVKHSLNDAALSIENRFHVPRVVPSTVHRRSRGRPPFLSPKTDSLLPSIPSPSSSSSQPRFVFPSLPHFLRPSSLLSSFPSSPSPVTYPPSNQGVWVELQSKPLVCHFYCFLHETSTCLVHSMCEPQPPRS